MPIIGPSDPEERRQIELNNLDAVEDFIDYLWKERPGFSVSTNLICELHRLVINGLYDCAGQFRTAFFKVYVTSPTFSPAAAYEIEYCIHDTIEEYYRRQSDEADAGSRLDAIAWFFHRFLQIHPFCGGNGRVARTLLSILLHRAGILPRSVYIDFYVRQHRAQYLTSLQMADRGHLEFLTTLLRLVCCEAMLDWGTETLRPLAGVDDPRVTELREHYDLLEQEVQRLREEFNRIFQILGTPAT